MRLFDSHCHIDDAAYLKDLDQVFFRAREAGVRAMLIAGISPDNCPRVVALAEKHPECYASVGVHPHDAQSLTEEKLEALGELSRHPRVVAWGETGLDYNRMFSPREVQERWFVRQLECARERALPLILHERDSGGRLFDLLRAHGQGLPGVVHCFSGTEEELSAYLDLGLHIGITGVLTQKERGAELRRLVLQIPLERLLIETDAPYLTPAPFRNRRRRNEPAFVAAVAETLAGVLCLDVETVAEQTWNNACRLFGVDL
jgi:TatD DNase family protein